MLQFGLSVFFVISHCLFLKKKIFLHILRSGKDLWGTFLHYYYFLLISTVTKADKLAPITGWNKVPSLTAGLIWVC